MIYSRKILEELSLPEALPWLGFEDHLFVGSGKIGGYGDTKGHWHNITGPAYTLNSFVQKSRMQPFINGKKHFFTQPMRRAKGTGIYYSADLIDGVYTYLIDFAPRGESYLVRMIGYHNASAAPVTIAPYGELKRAEYVQYGAGQGVSTRTADGVHYTQDNKYGLSALYAGETTLARIYEEEKQTVLTCPECTLTPGETKYYALYILTYETDALSPDEASQFIRSRDGVADLKACCDEWQSWLAKGRDLSFIKDLHAYNLVEGTRVLIRSEQSPDGGIMSCPGSYTYCYIRDNHSALRGMLAAGDVDVAEQYLHYINNLFHRLIAEGHFGIPTACPIGTDTLPFFGFDDEDNWSNETPGLYVLTVKSYYEKTKNLDMIRHLWDILTYAIDKQLAFAKKNDYIMIFNGDETESGGCAITMKESIIHGQTRYSMPSQVICIASVRFYMEMLSILDPDADLTPYEEVIGKLTAKLENFFWNEERGVYDWMVELNGKRCDTYMCNFQIFPLYFGIGDADRARRSALAMKQFILPNGLIPNQALSENEDFVGHNLGYMLYAMTELDDPAMEQMYQSVKDTADCWGLWAESYYANGIPYGPAETWDSRRHTLRPFESGTNIEAIIKYWEAQQ